jgi:hypothetical protein
MKKSTPENPVTRTTISMTVNELAALKDLVRKEGGTSLSALLVNSAMGRRTVEIPFFKEGLRTFHCKALCKDGKSGPEIVKTFAGLTEHVHQLAFDDKMRSLTLTGGFRAMDQMVDFAKYIEPLCEIHTLQIF